MSALYESLLRPLLFSLPAETAHEIGKFALRGDFPWNVVASARQPRDARLRTTLRRLELASPVGLAAGFDKNGEALNGLQHLGYGYLTVGSILPARRTGNPRPRLIRYPDRQSLLNCYGLPSHGLEACVSRLRHFAARAPRTPVIANIDAPSTDLYLRSFDAVEPHVAAVELGMQCPNNTEDHGEFHNPRVFETLLKAVLARRRKPVFVKILSFQDDEQKNNRLELAAIAARLGVDGITLPGTWRQNEPGLSLGYGHSSGHMVFAKTLQTVRDLHAVTRGRIAIKANGGIFNGEEAFQVLAAGASAVEILTAFVYRGWDVAARINRELMAVLDREGVRELREIRELASA